MGEMDPRAGVVQELDSGTIDGYRPISEADVPSVVV
jgi:hypothetical protein